MCFACMFVCAPCVCLVPVEARRAHLILKAEWKTVVSCHMDVGTEPGSSKRANKKNVSSMLSHSSSPLYLFFNINFHFKVHSHLSHLNVVSIGESLAGTKRKCSSL